MTHNLFHFENIWKDKTWEDITRFNRDLAKIDFQIYASLWLVKISFNQMFEKSLKSSLVFHPRKKDEIWRFLTYQLCHGSFNHIFGNMLVSFLSRCWRHMLVTRTLGDGPAVWILFRGSVHESSNFLATIIFGNSIGNGSWNDPDWTGLYIGCANGIVVFVDHWCIQAEFHSS